MGDAETETTAGTGSPPAPAEPTGHAPAGPESVPGHDAETPESVTPEGPPGPSAKRFQTQEEAERAYRSAQQTMGRLTGALTQMGVRNLGELRQALGVLGELRANPRFREWAEAERARETTGSDEPETRKALQIIEQIAEAKARQQIEPLMQERVEQRTQQVFSQMDAEFPDWSQFKPQMKRLLQEGKARGLYDASVEREFDYEFVRGLYLQAAYPDVVRRAARARLAEKRAASTESTPGTPGTQVSGAKPAGSIAEAWAQAQRQLSGQASR